jgi:hypothetical protein
MQRRLPGVAPNLGTCSQITRLRGECIDRSHFDREYGHKPRVRRRDLTVLRTWSSDSAAYFMALRSLCTQVEAARPQCRTGAPDWLCLHRAIADRRRRLLCPVVERSAEDGARGHNAEKYPFESPPSSLSTLPPGASDPGGDGSFPDIRPRGIEATYGYSPSEFSAFAGSGSDCAKILKRSAVELHKRLSMRSRELNFCDVLGDALCAER